MSYESCSRPVRVRKGRAGAIAGAVFLLLALLAGCTAAPRLLAGLGDAVFAVQSGARAGQGRDFDRAKLAREGHGILALVFHWPTGGQAGAGRTAQRIPDSTSKIDVAVLRAGTTLATGSVTRNAGEATASVTLLVPVGSNLSVLATAIAGTTPIARATAAGINVQAGKTTSAGLIMFSLYTPAITEFDYNAGGEGDTITLTGTNFQKSWADTPVVKLQGTGGASVSATVTSASDTEIAFTVPEGAAIGRVEVTGDGIPSYSSATFWVASALDIDATKASWDSTAADIRTILYNSALTFTATPTWALAPGHAVDEYGTAPEPAWTSSNASAGSLATTTGTSSVFTAGATFATSSITASLGGLSGNALTARSQAIGPWVDTGRPLVAAMTGVAAVTSGPYVYAIGGQKVGPTFETTVQQAQADSAGILGTFTAVGVPALNLGRSSAAAARVGNYLYVFGGARPSQTNTATVERIAVDSTGKVTGSWEDYSATSDLIVALRAPGAVVVGGYVYVVGGYDMTTRVRTVQRAAILDEAGNIGDFSDYSGTSQLATGRSGPGVIVVNKTVYAIGGMADPATVAVEEASFDIAGNLGAFGSAGNLPGARANLVVGLAGGRLLAIGGMDASNVRHDTVFGAAFDADGAIGTFDDTGASILAEVDAAAATGVGNYLYVLGGRLDTGSFTDTVQRAYLPNGGAAKTINVTVQ